MASSKTLKIVKVKWLDATGHADWMPYEEVEHKQVFQFYSIGALIEDTKERVVVALTVGNKDLSNILCLPRGCVLTIDEVGEVEIED